MFEPAKMSACEKAHGLMGKRSNCMCKGNAPVMMALINSLEEKEDDGKPIPMMIV